MSITTRLLLLILPLVLVAFGAVGGFSLYQMRHFQADLQQINTGAKSISQSADVAQRETARAISEKFNESLNLYFHSLVNILEERIRGFERVMGTIVHNGSVVTYMNGDAHIRSRLHENLQAYFSELVDAQGLSEASLLNAEGYELLRAQDLWAPPGKNVILDGVPLPNVRLDERESPWFQAAATANSGVVLSRYYYFDENFEKLQRTAVLSLSKRLEYAGFRFIPEHGNLKGFLRFVIPLQDLVPEIFEQHSSFGHRIFLLNADNVVLLSNDQETALGAVYDQALNDNGILKAHDFSEGELRLKLIVPSEYLQESMSSVAALSEAIDRETKALETFSRRSEASIRVTTQFLLIGCALGICVLAVALIFISKHLAKPIKWLSETTVKISDGALELPAKVPMHATHEILSLAEGVDEMRIRLRDHIYTLDQKVKDKTDELSAYNRRLEEEVEVRRQAEVAARKASKAKSEFLATMSHEIRTPMNGVIGMVEQLMQSELTPDQKEITDIIRLSGNHLLVIINDILDYSKIDAGKMSLEQVPVDMVCVLEGVVKLLRPQATRKGLMLELTIAADFPRVMLGDPVRINQVLINLVGNAIKFTAEGRVDIRAYMCEGFHSASEGGQVGDAIVFEISDTGVGIPPDRLEHLFDPFSQVDSSTTRRFGGTGLGLSITTRLVTLMEGALRVTSTPSEGSVFTVQIPYLAVDEVEIAHAAFEKVNDAPALRHTRSNFRVLVAEDNPVNQKIADRILRALGVQAEFVENGVEAVKRVRDQVYDLVFMDCQMPVLDGYEATIRIRELERLQTRKAVPIVAMTANAMPEDKALCLRVGMDEFVSKPIKQATLSSILETFGAMED